MTKNNIHLELADSIYIEMSQLIEATKGRFIYCLPRNKDIAVFVQNMKFFSSVQVIELPEYDGSIFDNTEPTEKVIGQRVEALSQIYQCAHCLIVTTPKAMMQKIVNPSFISNRGIDISAGQNIDIEDFQYLLQEAGYNRVSIASSLGDYALRGEIVDVVATGYKGYRIGFDFDSIEFVKNFDLSTQLSNDQNIGSVQINVFNEIFINQQCLQHFQEALDKGLFSCSPLEREMILSNSKAAPFLRYYPVFFAFNCKSILQWVKGVKLLADDNFDNICNRAKAEIESDYALENEDEYFLPDLQQYFDFSVATKEKFAVFSLLTKY